MDEILITEADIDLAHALENTISNHRLLSYINLPNRPVIVETPNGFYAIGNVSVEPGFIIMTVLE